MKFVGPKTKDETDDFLKTRIESLNLSARTKNALINSSIRTVGGILRNKETLYRVKGLGIKGAREITKELSRVDDIEINNKKINLDLNNETSDDYVTKSTSVINYGPDAVDIFADYFDIPKEDLVGSSRVQDIVRARQISMYILRTYYDLSFSEIGRLMGGKDHTTIMYSINKIKEEFSSKKDFELEFSELVQKIKGIERPKPSMIKTILTKIPFSFKYNNEKVENDPPWKNFIIIPTAPKQKKISERDLKVLDFFSKGESLDVIAQKMKVSRQRIQQVVVKTVKQKAYNESSITNSNVEFEALFKKVKEERRFVIESNKPKKLLKPEKIKMWSRYYNACKSCGRTSVPHFGRGLCNICGNRSITGEEREKMIEDHNNKCDICNLSRDQAIKKCGRDFYLSRKSNKVLCKECFQETAGKSLSVTKKTKWKMFYGQ